MALNYLKFSIILVILGLAEHCVFCRVSKRNDKEKLSPIDQFNGHKFIHFGRNDWWTDVEANSDPILTLEQPGLFNEKTPVWLARNNGLERADDTIMEEAVRFHKSRTTGELHKYEVQMDTNSNPYFAGSIVQKKMNLQYRLTKLLRAFETTLQVPAASSSNASIIYPELLIVVDFDQQFTSIREFRFLDLLTYVICFWNSVQNRFSRLRNPQIQLRITGIVISMERSALSYIQSSIDRHRDDHMRGRRALKHVYAWFEGQNEIERKEFDIILTMTNLNLFVRNQSETTIEEIPVIGVADLAVHCDNSNKLAGIIHDNNDYSGIYAATQSLSLILGAAVDADVAKPNECSTTEGYVMPRIDPGVFSQLRDFDWSECRRRGLAQHLTDNVKAKCYHNSEPHRDQGPPIEELLPGHKVTDLQQCQNHGWDLSCETRSICASLRCRKSSDSTCTNTQTLALDGTPCQHGGVCRNGICDKNI